MRFAFILSVALISYIDMDAQDLLGRWQMVKDSNCMDEKMTLDEGTTDAFKEMRSKASPTPQILTFKKKQEGEESTRILSKKKGANNNSFMYKFAGQSLMILDKKSRTLTETFSVEKLTADSLILSNSKRPCETKVFVRIK